MQENEIKTYLKTVKKCPLFRKVPAYVIRSVLLCEDTLLEEKKSGEILSDKGMYVITEGSVQIEKPASDGRFVTMNIAKAPAPVGIAAALSGERSGSRITMVEDGVVIYITGETMVKTLEGGGQFAVNVTQFLTNRIKFLNSRIISLAGYSASSRLTLYLQENRRENIVEIPMSMKDFAEYLGVGRASLYRALESMEKSGKIRCTGRRIEILE